MLSQNKLLGLLFVFMLFVSFTYSESEKGSGVDLAPSAVLEVDVLQSFAEDDKTGSTEIGRLETGIEAAVGGKVEAGLFVELGNDDVIGLLETWFTFKPVEVLSLTAGQLTMPFGEYATELFTDPLVMCGYEDEDSIVIPGAETIFPGFIAGVDVSGFYAMAGVYNASYSERFEAFCVKLGYAFKDIVSAGASVRFEPSSKIDLDVSLSVTPVSFFTVIGEVYTGLNDGESDNRLLGIHGELDIIPVEELIIPLRFGRLVDNREKGSGDMQLAGGARYLLNDHITFGIEFNSNALISNGEIGHFDNIGVRFGFGIE